MAWITIAVSLARSIFEGLASLIGGGGVSLEELNEALTEAVNEISDRTYLIVYTQIEYHELKDAETYLGASEDHLQSYVDTGDKDKLLLADEWATLAWNQLEDGVNLIAPPPGPNWTNQVGEGLLGHPTFLLAASLRLKILEEWIHYYEREGFDDESDGARNTLRKEIQEAITIARGMEDEWASFTRRRFTPLQKKMSTVPRGWPVEWAITGAPGPLESMEIKLRVRWIYYFNGAKQIAREVIWERGQPLDKIQEGAVDALHNRLSHIEQELNRVREGLVDPSVEVRGEWARGLFELGPQKEKMAEAYSTFEKAMEATSAFNDPLIKSYFESHPEAIQREPPKPRPRMNRSLSQYRRL